MTNEPEIIVQHREELLDLLSEAAEIEHNLMCCYLYAAFSMKSSEAEGLSAREVALVAGWKRAIMAVAIDEMTHLSLVANVMSALGTAPHFARPNFPVERGYHPSGVVVSLAPFDRGSLDHFIYLERPEGIDLADGAGFDHGVPYLRGTRADRLMPSAQDYATVGHLYRGIRGGLIALSERLGEHALFVGNPACQIGVDSVALSGLSPVADLASALRAIDTIVEQGEGTQTKSERSHYCRFLRVRDEYEKHLTENPDFVPSRPVARNPVMRAPVKTADRVWICDPEAARVLDLSNALYTFMLRLLADAFGAETHSASERSALLDAGVELMHLLAPIAEYLTTLPAGDPYPGVNAGVSFAMLRTTLSPLSHSGAFRVLSQRSFELSRGAARLSPLAPGLFGPTAERLESLAVRFAGFTRSTIPPRAALPVVQAPPSAAVASAATPAIEEVRGKGLLLRFEGKRCIHARHCVLEQPNVFLANVKGPWLKPDAASVESLVRTAHNCPSGAITYQRTDGGPEERAPRVNLLRVRENGPLAAHAELSIGGVPSGFRATLCRCGASKNKPFCDGSHHEINFQASGEPPTEASEPLAARDGVLSVRPQPNGPYLVAGNLELVSGTGRTLNRVSTAALCRCGGSSRKPFCDGTHARIGFRAD